MLLSSKTHRAALAAGSHWQWMTSGHFNALAACGVNAQLYIKNVKKKKKGVYFVQKADL